MFLLLLLLYYTKGRQTEKGNPTLSGGSWLCCVHSTAAAFSRWVAMEMRCRKYIIECESHVTCIVHLPKFEMNALAEYRWTLRTPAAPWEPPLDPRNPRSNPR